MKTIIHVLLVLAMQSFYAQNSLEGTIRESHSNTSLPFVSLYVPQLEKGSTSDQDGHFNLKDIPNGSYKIIASIIGYETVSITVVFPSPNPIIITLRPSAIEMEEIIISTPFHKLQSENVMKVERKKIADLKSKGAITLSDAITSIAGVESVTTGISVGKPVIRGLSSNRVLVYTQGVRLENQQFGDEHGLGLNAAGIESIEVIKGPASLLYGSDALGGVLYLNPERFAKAHTQSADVSANYFTNTQGFNTNAGFKSSGEHFKFLFRGSIAAHSDYKTKDYRVTNTRFKEQDFKTGIAYQKTQFKTEFRYNINNSTLGIPEEIGEQSTNKSPLSPFQEITNHIFSSKSSVLFENSSLDINLGYIYNNRKEFEEHHEDEEGDDHEEEQSLPDEAVLHMKLKTFNYDIKYKLPKLGIVETIVGVQGMNQINSNYGEEQLIPDATTNDIGILATSHIHFKTVDLQLGMRYDYRTINVNSGINETYNSFNGATGIKTNLFKEIIARLNLATGFRAPNLAELTSDGTHEGSNRYEIGNQHLKNEQNIQVDFALEYKNKHVEVFVNTFYNAISNYIFISPNGNFIDDTPVFTYLQDDARLFGGEIGLHIHPHPLDWLHFESSFETVTGQLNNKDYLSLIPASSIHNTVRMEFNTNWVTKGYIFAKLSTTFDQNNVGDFESRSKSYSLLSAGFGGTIKLLNKDFSFSVSGNNLTDKTYINHLSRLKSDGIYNIGRHINLGLKYHI